MIWILVFFQIIALDILLSGDNAVVIAGAANNLPRSLRNTALVGGIALALLVRVLFVSVAGLLIHVKFISVAGGLMLFWIAYKMIKNYFHPVPEEEKQFRNAGDLLAAIAAIVIADVSMSLDNIVAIAGLSKGHPWAMVFGLALSVAILGLGARMVCSFLERYKWLNLCGAGMIGWIGLTMLI